MILYDILEKVKPEMIKRSVVAKYEMVERYA
jgi:hypothetical protein